MFVDGRTGDRQQSRPSYVLITPCQLAVQTESLLRCPGYQQLEIILRLELGYRKPVPIEFRRGRLFEISILGADVQLGEPFPLAGVHRGRESFVLDGRRGRGVENHRWQIEILARAQTGLGQPLLAATGMIIADDQSRLGETGVPFRVLAQDEPRHVRLGQSRGSLIRPTSPRTPENPLHASRRQSLFLVNAVVPGSWSQARVRKSRATVHPGKVDAAEARVQRGLRHPDATIP